MLGHAPHKYNRLTARPRDPRGQSLSHLQNSADKPYDRREETTVGISSQITSDLTVVFSWVWLWFVLTMFMKLLRMVGHCMLT